MKIPALAKLTLYIMVKFFPVLLDLLNFQSHLATVWNRPILNTAWNFIKTKKQKSTTVQAKQKYVCGMNLVLKQTFLSSNL